MFNLIKELRNNDYSDELFVVGGISETKVEELARKLNVTFTNSYKEFLMRKLQVQVGHPHGKN